MSTASTLRVKEVRSRVPVVSLTVVLLIVSATFAYYYETTSFTIGGLQRNTISLSGEADSLNSAKGALESSISSMQATVSSQSSLVGSLDAQVASLNGQVNDLQGQVDGQAAYISALLEQTRSPTLTIWSAPVTIQPGQFLYEGVPDTFDYSDNWASSSPVTVYYLTIDQAARYFNCTTPPRISCVNGIYSSSGPARNANDEFKLAEGCGAYVAIYQPSDDQSMVKMNPNVSVTYNPSSVSTGACAQV
jgi:hypothetical protein